MEHYVTGATIKRLREAMHLTQAELAQRLSVSDKTVSKWETGRGLPDITLLEPLARALSISVIELFSGETVVNRNRAWNMRRTRMYVCPVCGNMIAASGEAVISCCGVTLPALEAEAPDEAHAIRAEYSDGEWYVSLDHDMSKAHHIAFIACAADGRLDVVRLYPEGAAEARFPARAGAALYAYCSHHGLFTVKVPSPAAMRRSRSAVQP